MVLLLKHEEVMQTVSMDDAIVAMESGFKEEGEGGALLPQRINVKAGKGWFRVGPVVLQNSGWVGFKAMNLAPGHGASLSGASLQDRERRVAEHHGCAAPHDAADRRDQRGRNSPPRQAQTLRRVAARLGR